ncbi:hypothetical protein M758_3G022700 [Ceratodon purpureus]|uniref:Secreted protein n=1 Tax=Ceratodon purpureus TaxID=3225 RepID=A0A8T0IGB6_CERPU|nr:hypothetical protein KC19_3G022500 [Ceratodon purpureus]KAG0621473.1 hypothetical protein M758_3G022700 [Ceratodon purpureus]
MHAILLLWRNHHVGMVLCCHELSIDTGSFETNGRFEGNFRESCRFRVCEVHGLPSMGTMSLSCVV